MKWISVLGDSICTFEGYNAKGYYVYYDKAIKQENGIKSVSDTWWHKVINYLDGQLCVNNSYAGSTVTGADFPSASSELRINDLSDTLHKPDIILIAMGFNDYAFGIETKGSGDVSSFDYAFGYMLDKISLRYPNTELICSTIPKGFVKDFSNSLFPMDFVKYDISKYNDIIRSSCQQRNIRLADIASLGTGFETLDGVHPTAAGHKTIAEMWINSLEKNSFTE